MFLSLEPSPLQFSLDLASYSSFSSPLNFVNLFNLGGHSLRSGAHLDSPSIQLGLNRF